MPTFLWIVFATGFGALIGHGFFDGATAVGAGIGFIVGLVTAMIVHFAGGQVLGNIFECIGDIFSAID
jgi:hypothetical protein